MAQVMDGRFTARMDEPFVVFMIGMRSNNFFAVNKWLPTMRAMGPMLRELYQHPEKGFLGGEFFLYWRGPRWSSTGAPSRSSKGSPETRKTRTSPHGAASIRPSARTDR